MNERDTEDLREDVLMCHEDLEARYNLSQRDGTVIFPFLHGFNIIDHNNKVFLLALVMDLGLGSVSTRHDGRNWLLEK